MSPGAADAPTTSYSIEIVFMMCMCVLNLDLISYFSHLLSSVELVLITC
jgi:hypothetical protein